ncbi:MAG: hypothetical protein ACYSWP_01075 [Planctomycetota bacterium]|jgi:hypothetical protein
MFKSFVVLVLTACIGTCFAVEDSQKESVENLTNEEQIKLPAKNSNEYWVVRSQAVVEIIPFLTKKRTEVRKHSKLLKEYLVSIGKTEDFLASGIKAPLSPKSYAQALGKTQEMKERHIPLSDKPLSWQKVVDLAMKHVLREGYLPTDIEGDEELQMYKDICMHKEKYGKKVRNELRSHAQQCLNMWQYLEKIEKQAGYKVFLYENEKQDREAREAEKAKTRERVQYMREQRVMERELKRRDAYIYRHNRLRSRYNRYYW